MKKLVLTIFLLTALPLCAASSFSGGGCRSSSFSSSRSMSFSSVKMSSSIKANSYSSSKPSFSTSGFKSSYTPRTSYYSSYRSYTYRPYGYYNTYGMPFYVPMYNSYSPLNNMWFWMYMMNSHNNNSVFQPHNDLQNWDGNSDDSKTNDDTDGKTVVWVLVGICVFITLVVLIAVFI